jgi:hypothetical protein
MNMALYNFQRSLDDHKNLKMVIGEFLGEIS